MRNRLALCVAFLAALGVGWTAARVVAQDTGDKPGAGKGPAAMQMPEETRPGKEHEGLAKLEGRWTFHAKFWMDPSTPPENCEGTAEFKPVLGGRFLCQEVESEMMGEHFQGIEYLGYDRFKNKYTTVWMDNMGTQALVSEGTRDSKTGEITYVGEQIDCMTKQPCKFRTVVSPLSGKQFTVKMYVTSGGKEMQMGELAYTRAEDGSESGEDHGMDEDHGEHDDSGR